MSRPARPCSGVVMTTKLDVTSHVLVPKHAKISEKERKELFEKYVLSPRDLPRIFKDDSTLAQLEVKEGDIVKIMRSSPTAGTTVFYRKVVGR